MAFRQMRRFLSDAMQNLARNRLMTTASVFTVACCMLVVSAFYVVAANIEHFMRQVPGQVGIVIFIDEYTTTEGIQAINHRLNNMPHIVSHTYIPPEVTHGEMETELEISLEGVPYHTFRHSFEIFLTDLQYHDDVVRELYAMDYMGVSRIRDDTTVVATLLRVTHAVNIVSLVFIAILGFVSIIVITNTIRIALNARRAEINVMKYVGATDRYVRWPFLIEGITIGILGSAIPVALTWWLYEVYLAGNTVLGDIMLMPSYRIFMFLFPFVLFLGIMIGVVGAAASLRKHLHV